MKYIRSLLILSVLSFSLSSMALTKQPVDLPSPESQTTVYGLGAPQFGINDVKPTSSGGCSVRGTTSGAWSGSPCEKLYGPTAPMLKAPELPATSPSPESL